MPESHKSRRWLQLSLRSLLFVTLLIAAYFAGVATMMRRVEKGERERQAARREAEGAAIAARTAEEKRQALMDLLVDAEKRFMADLQRLGVLERLRREAQPPAYLIPQN